MRPSSSAAGLFAAACAAALVVHAVWWPGASAAATSVREAPAAAAVAATPAPKPSLDDEGCPREGLRPRKRPGGLKDVPPQLGRVGATDPELAREMFRAYLVFAHMPPDVSRNAGSSPYDCALPCVAEAPERELSDDEVLERLDPSKPPPPRPKPKGVFGAPACDAGACGAPETPAELQGRYACARTLRVHLDRVVELAAGTPCPPQVLGDALHFLLWALRTPWPYGAVSERPCVDLRAYAADPGVADPAVLLPRLREVAQAAREAARKDPGAEHCGEDLLWHHGACCKRCVLKSVCETHDAPKFEEFDRMPKSVPSEQVLSSPFAGSEGFVPFAPPRPPPDGGAVTFLLRHVSGPKGPVPAGLPTAEPVGCEGHLLVRGVPRERAAAAVRPLLTPDGRLGRLAVPAAEGGAPTEYQPEPYDGTADLERLRRFAGARADLARFAAAFDSAVQLLTAEVEVQGADKRWGYFRRLGERLVELGAALRGVPSPWAEQAAAYVLHLMDAPQPVVEGRRVDPPAAVGVPGEMLHGGGDCEALAAAEADARTRASRDGAPVEAPEAPAARAVRRRGELLVAAGSDAGDAALTPAQLRLRDSECRALFGQGYAWLHACNNCVRCPDGAPLPELPRAAEARRRSVVG